MSTLITIGLITYNRPELLRETVGAVLNQKYSNFELLIGNDCPDVPVTFEMLGIKPDARVKILNYPKNMGEIANMNYLLDISTTEWFTWMADDDACHPQWLSDLFSVVENSDSNISAVYSNYSTGSTIDSEYFNEIAETKPTVFQSNIFIEKYVSRHINLIGCFGLMRTDALKDIGGIPLLGDSFGPYSDTLIPILLSQSGAIGYIDTPLVFLRVHKGSTSASSSDFSAFTTAEKDFLVHLRLVCSMDSKIDMDSVIYDMSLWFASNEFEVMSRNDNISRVALVLNYIGYNLRVNYLRINKKYWLPYSKYIITYVLVIIIRSIQKKFKNRSTTRLT
jgi:glycosyltransferase involved in cell wall biosynthesis